MEHPHEPIDVIAQWQEWYNKNRRVASLDTNEAIDSWLDACNQYAMKQAADHFADTIVEASASLSADEIYSCLLTAVQENYEHTEKEYNNAKRLLELIKNNV